MTEGTSQGLFVVVAIVIFGIFIGLTYTLFGSEGLSNDLENIFNDAFSKKPAFDKNADYNVGDVIPNEESDFIFDNVDTITGYVGTSTEVIIPKTIKGKEVTTISGDAFNDKGITKLIMPNSLTTIEDGSIDTVTANSAVNNFTGIESDSNKNNFSKLFENNSRFIMTVSAAETSENSRKVIGAFANNTIEEISFSANIEYIGSFAFFSGSLEDVVLPEGLLEIGESAFEENTLEEIKIPSTVTKLGNDSFKNNSLRNVSYGKGSNLTNIGSNVFSGNNIKDLEIPKGTTEIADNAYSNSGLESVKIPDGVTKIGKNAFSNNNLTEVVIPETVQEIDSEAFKENDLTNVELPNGLQRIGDYAFYKNKLPIVKLPESLLLIGIHAFEYNELLDVTIPSKLSVIKEWTFAHNKMPKKPTIPTNIKTEEANAFYGNLFSEEPTQSDYYDGKEVTMTDEKGFTISSNGTLTKYTGTSTDVVIPYEINGVKVTSIGEYAFNRAVNKPYVSPTEITSVTIPNTVTTIDDYAFTSNKLTRVVIPKSVTEIGSAAFMMNQITSVELPDSVTTIATSAFYVNRLTSVVIPDSVTTIGSLAFAINKLTSVEMGNSLTSIGSQAFRFNSLVRVVIPDSVKTIAQYSFSDNPTLKTVELPYGFKRATTGGEFQTGAVISYRKALQ